MPTRTASLTALAVLAVLSIGCSTAPQSPEPREALPLTEAELDRFTQPAIEQIEVASTRTEDGVRITRGKLSIEGHSLKFSTYVPVDPEPPHPFVDILPILAGGESVEDSLGLSLGKAGFASGVLDRPGRTFRDKETPGGLGAVFLESVRHQRAFLSWMQSQPGIDPARCGCIGLSLGGIVGTVLSAVDPRIRWSAICLAGADLPDIILHTNESRVRRWGTERMEADGSSPRELQRAIREDFGFDPAHFARAIDPGRVLFVRAGFDRTMPGRNSSLLWECLGRPRRITLPTEHYSSGLFLPWISSRIAEFARDRI